MNVTADMWAAVHSDELPAIVWKVFADGWATTTGTYSYAAFYNKAAKMWYLAGAAEWYGTRVCTDIQMLEVLQRSEVKTLWRVADWSPPL